MQKNLILMSPQATCLALPAPRLPCLALALQPLKTVKASHQSSATKMMTAASDVFGKKPDRKVHSGQKAGYMRRV